MEGYHVAITRRVRRGHEDQFVAALREFIRESLAVPGVGGALLIAPHAAGDERTYGILRTFDNEAASEQFYSSELFRTWEARVAPMVEGEYSKSKLEGLAPFFYGVRGGPPPKWKMAVVTWLGVFPAVVLWSTVLHAALTGLPALLMTALVSAFVVATLAWFAMPLLTRVLGKWLRSKSAS
jgi:antibiotic biosynthesis monooxygenase (ABM) superfamily enzyme